MVLEQEVPINPDWIPPRRKIWSGSDGSHSDENYEIPTGTVDTVSFISLPPKSITLPIYALKQTSLPPTIRTITLTVLGPYGFAAGKKRGRDRRRRRSASDMIHQINAVVGFTCHTRDFFTLHAWQKNRRKREERGGQKYGILDGNGAGITSGHKKGPIFCPRCMSLVRSAK